MSIYGELHKDFEGVRNFLGFGKPPAAPVSTPNFAGGMNRTKAALAGNFDAATSFKKGGKVKKTGIYKLHKGERVLTKKQAIARRMDYNKYA